MKRVWSKYTRFFRNTIFWSILLTLFVMFLVLSDSSASRDLQTSQIVPPKREENSTEQPLVNSDRQAEADRLFQRGIQLYQMNQSQEALESLDAALRVYQKIDNRDREKAVLRSLGTVYWSLGDYQQAIIFFKRSLFRGGGGRFSTEEALTLLNIGAVYTASGQLQEALSYYDQALPLLRDVRDRQGEATALSNIGAVYQALNQPQKALRYYTEGLSSLRAVGNRPGEGTTLNNIGRVYQELGQFAQALSYYNQSLSIRRAVGDRRGEATTFNNIGSLYNLLGRSDESLKYYQQALVIQRGIGDRISEAKTLNNIGSIYKSVERGEQALDFFNQALSIFRELKDLSNTAITLNNIGRFYRESAKPEQALKYHQDALQLIRSLEDPVAEAATLSDIGQIYLDQKQLEEALKVFRLALPIYKRIRDRAGEASILNKIGQSYLASGKIEEASKYFNEAQKIFRELNRLRETQAHENNRTSFNAFQSISWQPSSGVKQGKSSEQNSSTSRDPLDDLINQQNQIRTEVMEMYETTKAIFYLYNAASNSYTLGQVLLNAGRLPEALKILNEALSYYKQLSDSDGIARTLNNIAIAYRKLNQPNEAVPKLKEALSLTLKTRGELRRDNRQRFLQQKSRRELIVRLIDSLIDQRQYDSAFEWVNLATTAEIADYTRLINAKVANGEAQQIIEQWNQKNQRLLRQRQQLLNHFTAELSRQVRELEAEIFQDAEDIARRFPQVADLFETAPEQVAQLRARIPKGSVVVQPIVLSDAKDVEQSLALFVFAKNQPTVVKKVSIKQEEFNNLVEQYRKQSRDWRDSGFATSQEQLYDLLIRPIENEIKTIAPQQLSFLLTGQLRYISFESLYDRQTQQYLVQKYPINYITRLSTRASSNFGKPHKALSTGALIMGNPIPQLPYALPGAEQEAKDVAQLLVGSEILLENKATLDEFKVQAPRFPFLHLATHGCFDPEGCSSLNMAANTLLFADQQYDIANAALLGLANTELIVLSACQTAQSVNSNGEEIAGLAYLFERAGAKEVIAGLWNVEDSITRDIMVQFYRNLQQGVTKAEALRQAKLSHLDKHPFLWAPLVLIGDGR